MNIQASAAATQVSPSTPLVGKTATFLFGAGASGKSAYLRTLPSLPLVLDCDEIKKGLPGYDPQNPGLVHEESTRILRERHLEALQGDEDFILDGVGGNPRKMAGYFEEARAHGFNVRAVLVWCHPMLNLQRNLQRARTVPTCILVGALKAVPLSWAEVHTLADRWEVHCTNPGKCPSWRP